MWPSGRTTSARTPVTPDDPAILHVPRFSALADHLC
jgi:hypothetical protein